MRWFFLLCLIAALGNAKASEDAAPPLGCGDFMRQLGLQRPDVKFVSCEQVKSSDLGMDRLEAVYRVEGKDIAKVENWLIHFAHVTPLKFACCGWESSEGDFKGRDGVMYTIGMGGEASVSTRKAFAKIPFLKLRIKRYFERP
ncbi:DUF4952 domain-containing protein [Cupriavidus oxalaticus]|jgi:hypothetical protein|uniref:DUF4952 domain-containing protein n=3 Tax=Cupriavidus oxalaticus TaxID=96344 RepID=A0ABX7HZ47_9BURK|nr:DUF4952 domain-containing protein [Cupriavidus oxalaticus]QRQ86094.1 DUF4952 domain-containing protein [Cupriavidus oxalaticus]QRQ95579.1 DUF4952 domain-containing protein [Cupriavidus oxalaticus]WQD84242.1 DUF4952 domain-containing protein [Cupriavidus oxalaticus]